MEKLSTIKSKLLVVMILMCVTGVVAIAQQSNSNEDYSAYMLEVRKLNQTLAHLPPSPSALTNEGLAKARAGMLATIDTNTVLKPAVKYIQGPAAKLALYVYKPDTIRAVVLSIHGGGWNVGSPLNDAQLNDRMARACGVAVVSPDYRLAPEAPFPACIEDCKAAARWLVMNAQIEFGTDKIIVSGNSAGGHLAALTTLFIRDTLKAINRVKGVNLVYGVYDLSRTPSNRLANDTVFLPKRIMDDTWKLVFGTWTTEQLQQPRYSPLYANLHGLPPAMFTIGTADPLADDTYFMEARWRMAGNKTYLAVYPESPHGVDIFPTQLAKVAREKMHQWINDLLKK
ncbi:alpha/beta hydrolase [Spirosoma taeanense]|uniref:Alpha/beta hydrolase n=1 Tax=Spirosoma taeanense TaxID=2735870 RepID=A0A6M5Y4H3_9BACT|nr:alpha/beta hydrolase [Spirosoma taeanense]QJW88091.1 alpha/beta hydrolase [Spirosoma taeanense]